MHIHCKYLLHENYIFLVSCWLSRISCSLIIYLFFFWNTVVTTEFVTQVIKWMFNKGQGKTMGSYYTLLNALIEDGRVEEAEELYGKIFSRYLEGLPHTFFMRMISLYYRLESYQKMFEVGIQIYYTFVLMYTLLMLILDHGFPCMEEQKWTCKNFLLTA